MNVTGISAGLLLLSLGAWALLEWQSGRNPREGLRTPWGRLPLGVARAGLVVVALVAHLDLLDWSPRGLRVMLPGPHHHEIFHHVLGTRYFPEVGYTDLYHAVVLADVEDVGLKPDDRMRDLGTNRVIPRAEGIDHARQVRARFSDARWEAFKRDVAHLRSANTSDRWGLAVLDHGYNGTPTVTAALGLLSRLEWLPPTLIFDAAPFLDLALLGLLCTWLGWRAGGAAGLGLAFFILANPLNDFGFIGAAYLRYAYFLALAGALLALGRGRLGTAGALLALSGSMRLFPFAIYGFLVLRDLLQRDAWQRLQAGRRLHLGFVGACLAILAITSLQPTPDGRNPWLAFAENIQTHTGTAGINQVYIAVPFLYSASRDQLHNLPGSGEARSSWALETERVRAKRGAWIASVGALLALLAVLAVRRARAGEAVLLALLAAASLLPMTHYYWATLSLLPLALPDDRRLRYGLLGLFAILAITSADPVMPGRLDLPFALLSVEVLGFLTLAALAIWRGRAAPKPAERAH